MTSKEISYQTYDGADESHWRKSVPDDIEDGLKVRASALCLLVLCSSNQLPSLPPALRIGLVGSGELADGPH